MSEERIAELEDEVARLRYVVEVREDEIRHLRTQMGLVPTVALFRGLWRLLRESTENQAAKVRRMS